MAVPFTDGAVPIDWDRAEPVEADARGSGGTPPPRPRRRIISALPPAGLDAKRYAAWTKDFEQWVLRAERLMLYAAPAVKLTSQAGESERDFRLRVQLAQREARDAAVQKLRDRYAPKVARLTQRLQSAGDAVTREQQQASQQTTQTMVSVGATVLGALFGRKAVSLSTLGRATTAARGVGRSVKETEDVGRAQQRQQEAERELKALEAELAEEIAALSASSAERRARHHRDQAEARRRGRAPGRAGLETCTNSEISAALDKSLISHTMYD